MNTQEPCIVSIHQPCYFPWLGYMHKIYFSHAFVVHDNVQYEKKSFIRRVLIRKPHAPAESDYLIIPLRQHSDFALIRDLRVDNSQDWRGKHLRKMEEAYRKAPFFAEYFPLMGRALEETAGMDSLTDVVQHGVHLFSALLNCRTRIVRSSELPVSGVKSQYNVNLVKHLGGNVYYSGSVAAGYQGEDEYRAAHCVLLYSKVFAYLEQHPYEQAQGPFVNGLSMLDALFNIGTEGIKNLFAGYEAELRQELAALRATKETK